MRQLYKVPWVKPVRVWLNVAMVLSAVIQFVAVSFLYSNLYDEAPLTVFQFKMAVVRVTALSLKFCGAGQVAATVVKLSTIL